MRVSRRTVLKGAGAAGLLAVLPRARLLQLLAAAPGPGARGHFLDAHQLDTLRALCGRLVPGPSDAPGPNNSPPEAFAGAREARCAEAIDILLGAFGFDPPMVHAGGPFSGRHGSVRDDFAGFVALDPAAELGWRTRIEGSRGIKAREFGGPVIGLQQVYVEGLALLDARARSLFGVDFTGASGAQQDAVIDDPTQGALQGFVAAALGHTFDAMYGAPEYGGNEGLVGWLGVGFDGDVLPAGYTDSQVENPDASGALVSRADARLVVDILAAATAGGDRGARRHLWRFR